MTSGRKRQMAAVAAIAFLVIIAVVLTTATKFGFGHVLIVEGVAIVVIAMTLGLLARLRR